MADLEAVLQRLAQMEQAATPGPWEHVKDGPMFMGVSDHVRGPAIDVRGRVYREWASNPDVYAPQVAHDAAFIAAARSALPLLLDVARAARRVEQWIATGPREGEDGQFDSLRAALRALETLGDL